MRMQHVKPAIPLAVFAALMIIGCKGRIPAPQAGVYIPESDKQLDPLLLHEVRSLRVPSAEAAYLIINPTNDPCTLIFEDASCGCTSAEIDGKPLKIKDRFTLAAGASANFKLTSRLPVKPGLSSFRANLTSLASDGTRAELAVHYSVKILADIVLTPDVLLHEFHDLLSPALLKPPLCRHGYPCFLDEGV